MGEGNKNIYLKRRAYQLQLPKIERTWKEIFVSVKGWEFLEKNTSFSRKRLLRKFVVSAYTVHRHILPAPLN
jgi:hypothetical protein